MSNSILRYLAALRVLAQYQAAGVGMDGVYVARIRLLNARLDLCETKDERIRVLEEGLKAAIEWEKVVQAPHEAGGRPMIEILKAKADRLDSEIRLERARSTSTP